MNHRFLVSVFSLIFLAELPDKTAFASLFLATRHRPLAVFLGAAGAFVIQSAVAVLFGSLIGLLSPHLVHHVAGILFLVFAVLMARRETESEAEKIRDGGRSRFWKDFTTAFMAIFIAEWGDLTQLATATLAAKYRAPGSIFVAATLALWTVTGIGVVVGHHSRKVIQPHVLKWVAAAAFAGVGCWLLVRG